MGQSTDAIIAYGVNYGDEKPWEEAVADDLGDYDIEEAIAKAAGLKKPWDWTTFDSTPDDVKRDYWAQQRALVAEFPFDIERHCSADYPMYFVVARRSVLLAGRGYPKVIGDHMDQEFPWPVERLEEVGIWAPQQAPDWHLFSYWSY